MHQILLKQVTIKPLFIKAIKSLQTPFALGQVLPKDDLNALKRASVMYNYVRVR